MKGTLAVTLIVILKKMLWDEIGGRKMYKEEVRGVKKR